MPPDAAILAGRYRLLDVIGEGGMAVVHRARDEQLDRLVAVKVLRTHLAGDEEFVRRFRQEARSAAALVHQNIGTVFDSGTHEGVDYIVMQLVDGPDLERVLARRGRLPVDEALRVTASVADALRAAHERGIVHRDIKPGNILVAADGSVRVVDFGIARAVHAAPTTNPGLLLGTVHYLSPEQVRGEQVGPASDVYSLGLVLWELLTGRRPFAALAGGEGADSPTSVALARLHELPPPPSAVVPGLPRELDALVGAALAPDPAVRYPSAAAFAAAIRATAEIVRAGRDPAAAATRPLAIAAAGASGAAGLNGGPAGATSVGRRGRAGPAAPSAGGRRAPPRPPADRRSSGDRDRRRAPLWIIPLAAAILTLVGGWALGGGLGTDVPEEPAIGPGDGGSPSPTVAVVVPGTTATPEPTLEVEPTPSPTPLPTEPPTPEPTPTSAPATPPPTPAPPPPTPAPEPPAGPTAPARDPAATVARFYELVVAGEFDAAAALWSPRMRDQYPPREYIDGRFAPTTRIDLNRNELLSIDLGAGRAVVAVDLTEYRSSGPSPRRFVGRWDLVLAPEGWLLDRPHF